MNFGPRHYVPVLLARQAELIAIRELSDDQRRRFTPLFEIPYTTWINPEDFEGEDELEAERATKQGKGLDRFAKRIADDWGTERAVFVDAMYADLEGRPASGMSPLEHLLGEARQRGAQIIPVTGVGRSADQRSEVREAIMQDNHGVCVRIQCQQIDDFQELRSSLSALVDELETTRGETDLVVDFGSISPAGDAVLMSQLQSVLNELGNVDEWRTLTVTSSAFPEDLRSVSRNSEATFPRSEWVAWQALRRHRGGQRVPTFGDYAIDRSRREPVSHWQYTISPQLRYTADDHWVALKGRKIEDNQPWSFPDICTHLTNRPEYAGPSFSPGDLHIEAASRDPSMRGNPGVWRKVGFSHHLAFVLDRLANLPAP